MILIFHLFLFVMCGMTSIACFLALENAHVWVEKMPMIICGVLLAFLSLAGLFRIIELVYRRVHDGYWETHI